MTQSVQQMLHATDGSGAILPPGGSSGGGSFPPAWSSTSSLMAAAAASGKSGRHSAILVAGGGGGMPRKSGRLSVASIAGMSSPGPLHNGAKSGRHSVVVASPVLLDKTLVGPRHSDGVSALRTVGKSGHHKVASAGDITGTGTAGGAAAAISPRQRRQSMFAAVRAAPRRLMSQLSSRSTNRSIAWAAGGGGEHSRAAVASAAVPGAKSGRHSVAMPSAVVAAAAASQLSQHHHKSGRRHNSAALLTPGTEDLSPPVVFPAAAAPPLVAGSKSGRHRLLPPGHAGALVVFSQRDATSRPRYIATEAPTLGAAAAGAAAARQLARNKSAPRKARTTLPAAVADPPSTSGDGGEAAAVHQHGGGGGGESGRQLLFSSHPLTKQPAEDSSLLGRAASVFLRGRTGGGSGGNVPSRTRLLPQGQQRQQPHQGGGDASDKSPRLMETFMGTDDSGGGGAGGDDAGKRSAAAAATTGCLAAAGDLAPAESPVTESPVKSCSSAARRARGAAASGAHATTSAAACEPEASSDAAEAGLATGRHTPERADPLPADSGAGDRPRSRTVVKKRTVVVTKKVVRRCKKTAAVGTPSAAASAAAEEDDVEGGTLARRLATPPTLTPPHLPPSQPEAKKSARHRSSRFSLTSTAEGEGGRPSFRQHSGARRHSAALRFGSSHGGGTASGDAAAASGNGGGGGNGSGSGGGSGGGDMLRLSNHNRSSVASSHGKSGRRSILGGSTGVLFADAAAAGGTKPSPQSSRGTFAASGRRALPIPPHAASLPALTTLAPPPKGQSEASARLTVSALMLSFLFVTRALPGERLALLQRRAAEYFHGKTADVGGSAFNELVSRFRICLGPGNLFTKGQWFKRCRLWRFIFLMDPKGFWCVAHPGDDPYPAAHPRIHHRRLFKSQRRQSWLQCMVIQLLRLTDYIRVVAPSICSPLCMQGPNPRPWVCCARPASPPAPHRAPQAQEGGWVALAARDRHHGWGYPTGRRQPARDGGQGTRQLGDGRALGGACLPAHGVRRQRGRVDRAGGAEEA